jgi:glutaryl-CoA dehydrogenase
LTTDFSESLGTDFYLLEDRLTDQERAVRDKVRSFVDADVIPVINQYWDAAQFPFELIPRVAALGISGYTIEGYGCPGMSRLAAGLASAEVARGDGSINTFLGVHSGLAMGSIAMLGSEEQKQRWLPPMARLDQVGRSRSPSRSTARTPYPWRPAPGATGTRGC